MLGLWKPEKAYYVTHEQLKLALDAVYDDISVLSDRITVRNKQDGAAQTREIRTQLNEPMAPEAIAAMVAQVPEQYRGIATALLGTPRGQKMVFDLIKGLVP